MVLRANFDRIKVQFSESLMIPTEAGLPTRSNSMYESRSGSICKLVDHERWKKELALTEKIIAISTFYEKGLDEIYKTSALGKASKFKVSRLLLKIISRVSR